MSASAQGGSTVVSGKEQNGLVSSFTAFVAICTAMMPCTSDAAEGKSLWSVYDSCKPLSVAY